MRAVFVLVLCFMLLPLAIAQPEEVKQLYPKATFKEDSISYKGKNVEYWGVYEGGKLVAHVGKVNTTGAQMAGSNPLMAYVALSTDGIVKKVIVPKDQLKETPGIGTRITEESFLKQFEGLSAKDIALRSEGGKIDAITGATQSSSALVNGIKFVVEALSGVKK